MQVTKGMSVQRLQDVEKFNAHAALVELLLLLKDTVTDPKLMSDLAKRKADALKLTDDEEKKRLEALDLISRTDELKNSFLALDERERKIDQQHKDNLGSIDRMKAEAKQGFDTRDRQLKEAETALGKKHVVADGIVKSAQDKAKQLDDELRRKGENQTKKEEYLKGWESELGRRLGEVMEREKALFSK